MKTRGTQRLKRSDGRNIKGKVMIYILSKLEYVFTRYFFLLRYDEVTVDCPETCCVFIQEFKINAFMWPSDFDKEIERVYKQPRWAL